MADQSNNEPSTVDDLLVPPPFGVAETTGEQLLPIATSMDAVLDRPISEVEAEAESRALQAAAIEQARAQDSEPPVPNLAPQPVERVGAPPIAAPKPAPVVSKRGSNGARTGLVVVAVLLLLGIGGWLALSTSGGPPSEARGITATKGETRNVAPEPSTPPKKVDEPTPEPSAAVAELPTTLDELRKISYAERHAGLETAMGDVPVELHVGLDLVQANESPSPCATFSDAISTIESSPDPSVYAWALDEAEAPSQTAKGADASACEHLDARLKSVKDSLASAAPEPAAARRPRTAPKPRKALPTPAPAAQPRKTPPPSQEPPKRAPSVATKLDDDLKGLGE